MTISIPEWLINGALCLGGVVVVILAVVGAIVLYEWRGPFWR